MGRVPIPPPPTQKPSTAFGERNIDLPDDVREALRQLIYRAEEDNREARQEEVRRVQRQRMFFRGRQNIFYNELTSRWSSVTDSGLQLPSEIPENAIRYSYVENLYRVESLLHISIMRQNPPRVQFRPQNFDQPEDVATAREAKKVAEFVKNNNELDKRMAEAIWFLDHDGRCMSYTYWETSKELYGSDWYQNMTPQPQTMPGKFVCPNCGSDFPEPQAENVCPTCMAQAPPLISPLQTVPPETVMVDQPEGDPEEEPRGQEKALFMGALETAVPFSARTLRDCGWLSWETEVEKAFIKTIYPEVADQDMNLGNSGDTGDSAEARNARLSLMGTSWGYGAVESSSSLVTFRRYWIRPWYFNTLTDEETVKKLVQAFPDGCFVAFAGAAYCESRMEQIEERWKWVGAFPGDGIIRDGWLYDYVDMQRKINTAENLKFEIIERGPGTRFIDDKAVDYDAYIDQGAQAVNEMAISLRPGEKAADKIYDSPPAMVSPDLVRDSDSMRGQRSEKLTGNLAAVYGGDTGTNDTARGIVEMKDSGMGRMSYFKEILNELYAGTIQNLIRCFRKNRKDDVKYAILGPSGDLDAEIINIDELKGNCYAITEAEDAYPVSPSQQRTVLLGIMNGPATIAQQALFSPENYDKVRWALGADVTFPGESARRKQMREIQQMKKGVYVQVDAVLDQHDYEIGACNEWGSSEDGQAAAPEVRELVAQHMIDHFKAKGVVAKILAETDPNAQANADAAAQSAAPPEGGAEAPM